MPVHRKVQAGAIGGALGIIVVWILESLGVDVPSEVGAAISTVIGATLGWLVPAAKEDTP
jgi:hypothetical protein